MTRAKCTIRSGPKVSPVIHCQPNPLVVNIQTLSVIAQLDGDSPTVLPFAEFVAANVDGMSIAELAAILATVSRGEVYTGGGGAAPVFTIRAA